MCLELQGFEREHSAGTAPTWPHTSAKEKECTVHISIPFISRWSEADDTIVNTPKQSSSSREQRSPFGDASSVHRLLEDRHRIMTGGRALVSQICLFTLVEFGGVNTYAGRFCTSVLSRSDCKAAQQNAQIGCRDMIDFAQFWHSPSEGNVRRVCQCPVEQAFSQSFPRLGFARPHWECLRWLA